MQKELIDRAYAIFSKYEVSRPLDVCTDECCMKVEDEGRLASLPVSDIPLELLAEYNDSAKPEKTRIEELKHFLPRYLALIADFKFPSHSMELSFSRLVPFDRNEWTELELKLLDFFSETFFQHCLNSYPLPSFNEHIDSVLIMFWKGQFMDMDRLLNIWEQTEDVAATLHYKDFVLNGFEYHNRKKLSNTFADMELSKKLVAWTESAKTRKIFEVRIESIFMGESIQEEQTLNELSLLYEIVRS